MSRSARETIRVASISPATPHRVAISNSRLIRFDEAGLKWKDYRIKGRDRLKTMTLNAAEFIRRLLLHVLPNGFHRIRRKPHQHIEKQKLTVTMSLPRTT